MLSEIPDFKNINGRLLLDTEFSSCTSSAWWRYRLRGSYPPKTGSKSTSLSWVRWGSAAALPAAAALGGPHLPNWGYMCVLALGLFLGAKWITVFPLLPLARKTDWARLVAYLAFWPGMDAGAFCVENSVPVPPIREWILAIAKTSVGGALLWIGVPSLGPGNPLLIGWVGMVGVVFLLHFGLFHLLSLLWRAFGIDAKPIMQSPGTATSLSKFWGGSWNVAFSDLMRGYLLRPLACALGARGALFAIFAISGVLHELVISLPAHGGYGLPTIYFVAQGLCLLFERSKFGLKLRLGSGWRGWWFVAFVTGAPVCWLFHPIFVHQVILPMLQAIGSI